MRNSKTKVFVVCEDREYKDVNKVIGLFPTREEAEQFIRDRGEVICWKVDFMPFALVWAEVRATHKDYGLLSTWCWIETHEMELPKPKFFLEIVAMIAGAILFLLGVALSHHHNLATNALVLIGDSLSLIAYASVLIKS